MRLSEIQLFNATYHFEKALFGVLAPFLAPLFFPHTDYVSSLILYFAPYNLLAKPLGALFWGYLGDRTCRHRATLWSLAGMAGVTFLVGLLPSFDRIGWFAPLTFVTIRCVRGFFAAGASTGAPLILLEQHKTTERNRASSHYEVAGMSGVFLASALTLFLSITGGLAEQWRLLFLAGGAFSAFLLLRLSRRSWGERVERQPEDESGVGLSTWRGVLAIVFVTGFSQANYNLTMLLMHSYLPEIVEIGHAQIQALHLVFIGLDIMLLPFFGHLAQRVGKERLMLGMLLSFALFLIGLMAAAAPLSLVKVLFARFGMLVFGVAVAAPYHYWAQDQLQASVRFRGIALGKTLGKELLGAPAVSLSLLSMSLLGSDAALFLYVLLLTGVGAAAVALQGVQSGSLAGGRERNSQEQPRTAG